MPMPDFNNFAYAEVELSACEPSTAFGRVECVRQKRLWDLSSGQSDTNRNHHRGSLLPSFAFTDAGHVEIS
jgi:hypothetical protein